MFAGGAFFGFALLLSCDDDSPSDADAASCNCPPAEAPLLGRTQEFEVSTTLPPANMAPTFGKEGGFTRCPEGSVLLSGGCAAAVGAVPDILLESSAPGSNGWGCDWKNLSNAPVPVRSIARCLMPAQ
jgi:hypothetical protein